MHREGIPTELDYVLNLLVTVIKAGKACIPRFANALTMADDPLGSSHPLQPMGAAVSGHAVIGIFRPRDTLLCTPTEGASSAHPGPLKTSVLPAREVMPE
jgi:hypothetical protein